MTGNLYPCLWFDGKASEAANYYCSIFKDSGIVEENSLVVIFTLNGNKFMALNGGPYFSFNEAVSFVVNCKTQVEIDYYWNTFINDGGKESKCGWLKDKYGLSWQIVPEILGQLMANPSTREAVTAAFMKMNKFSIEDLKKAAGITDAS